MLQGNPGIPVLNTILPILWCVFIVNHICVSFIYNMPACAAQERPCTLRALHQLLINTLMSSQPYNQHTWSSILRPPTAHTAGCITPATACFWHLLVLQPCPLWAQPCETMCRWRARMRWCPGWSPWPKDPGTCAQGHGARCEVEMGKVRTNMPAYNFGGRLYSTTSLLWYRGSYLVRGPKTIALIFQWVIGVRESFKT